jgi:hypothetical protein
MRAGWAVEIEERETSRSTEGWVRKPFRPLTSLDLCRGGVSAKALALRRLVGQEERLDKLAFAADGHSREALVPRPLRDLRLAVEPGGEQLELLGVYATLVNAVEQVLE